MPFGKCSIRKFVTILLFSISFLICLNLLFMYVIYLEHMDLRGKIYRPDFKTLIKFYRMAQLNYADVQNHMLLVEHGYERIDTKNRKIDFEVEHINWAYPPLHPALARLLNFITGSSFWSLWIINQIVLLSIFVGFYYWSQAKVMNKTKRLSSWLVLLFFILSPLCYFINFMILPALLLGIIFFSLRSWLKSPQKHKKSFWILTVSSFLLGFSRFQGMLVNAALLFLIVIIIGWYKTPLGKTKILILSSANILPFIITLCLFKYYANDPFAWAKIQAAWGVSLSWPWTAIIRYWKSGLVFNLFADDLFFTSFRLLVFFVFVCLAAKILIFDKHFLKDFISRRFSDSFINLSFVVISFGLLILPLLQGVLLAAHRLMTIAFLSILIWFEVGREIHLSVVLFLIFVRAVEFTLFFQGVLAFIW